MSSTSTNDTKVSTNHQNECSTVASSIENKNPSGDKREDITTISPKQLQANALLNEIEIVLEEHIKEKQFSDYKELQNVIKNLAVILTNGEEETKHYILTTLNKVDNKVLFMLQELAVGLFDASIMLDTPLTPQHPLILTYYCINILDPSEKFVEVGIIHPIVFHLKVMELFMAVTGENLTLVKLLMGILSKCCDLDSALTILVQSGLHHALVYYIHTFGFGTVLQAKSLLAVIADKVERHFQQFARLTDAELHNVQIILRASIKAKCLCVKLKDWQGEGDYYIIFFIKMLRHLSTNLDNKVSLGSSTFIELYHSMLVEPDLSDAANNVLLLLKAICSNPTNKKVLQEENVQLLATLESFTENENLQAIAIEVIWTILNEDNSSEIKQTAEVNNDVNDIKEVKIASVLKILLDKAKLVIAKMEFYTMKTVFAEIFRFLRYLMVLSEHFTITVIEKCSSEIQSLLHVINDHCMWMICNEKYLEKSEWSLLVPLFLFHVLFYLLTNICDSGKKQLRDCGILKLIVKELLIIQHIPKWHTIVATVCVYGRLMEKLHAGSFSKFILDHLITKGIVSLAQLILMILLKCFGIIPQNFLCSGLLEQFCVEEDFLFRISAKPLLVAFSDQNNFNLKLVELLESEALSILKLLQTSSKNPRKMIQVTSSFKESMVFHLCFPEIEFIILKFLKANPANQKLFYNCCVHEAVGVLDSVHPRVQVKVENLVAFILSSSAVNDSNASLKTDLYGLLCKVDEYSEVMYWMCCISSSIRNILSSIQVDDNLVEEYVPFEEDSLFSVAQKDLIYIYSVKLSNLSTTQQGINAFYLFLLRLPQFLILLKSLLNLSFKRIMGNTSYVNVPASTLLRLQRILSLLQDHCQKSSDFCSIICHTGIITELINGLLILYACQSHHSTDFEWIMLHLAEPILYILAVCATDESLHGYLLHLSQALGCYCKVNSQRCKTLAKVNLAILSNNLPVLSNDFELNDPEVNFLLEVVSSIIYKQENEDYMWAAYTSDSNNSLYYFITFYLHLVANLSNAVKLIKAGILNILSFLFQHYKQDTLLKIGLQLLEKLSALTKISIEIRENHSDMIVSLQQLMYKDSLQEDVFYCLLVIRLDITKIIDLPNAYIDAMAMLRTGRYHDCINKLQKLIENETDPTSPIKIKMIQTIGESYYKLYTSCEHGDQRKCYTKDSDSEHYSNAKQAIKYLGIAYDHQLFTDEDTNSMYLDLAMMDCIFNVRDKPLSRCLLCRKKCGKGEKLIRSHIWPNALLQHLVSSFNSNTKQVFDVLWKGTGKLHGPGQIYFNMLCKSCENIFSKYERAFKSLCFEKLYCNASTDTKQDSIASYEIIMSTLKASGAPNNWLYLFCLSIAFRMFTVASKGCPTHIGNFKNWYKSFTAWRKILLKEASIQCEPAVKIALFITPINELRNLSPAMARALFSPGTGVFSTYRLHDGVNVSNSKSEFLLSSIGAVNIIVSCDEASFSFIPSECIVVPDSTQFVIPSTTKRHLLFPKGILMEYKSIATLLAQRIFNMPQDKVNAPFNKAWISEEMRLFSGALGESYDTDETDVCMNFLPAPFEGKLSLQQTITTLQSGTLPFKIILHEWVNEDDNWFVIIMLRNESSEHYPELLCIFIFQIDSYKISVAYKLSTTDLSVEGVIQGNSIKTFFPQVESHFEIKTLLQMYLVKAIKNAGFADISLFINWLKDFKNYSYCDLRCFPFCYVCFEICSCCTQKIFITDAIPIYCRDIELQAQVAIACSSQCSDYFTSTSSLPVILYKPKANSSIRQPVLRVCTNGVLFNLANFNGKFIIHYFTSESSDKIKVWCQYRLWYTQYIYTMLFDGSFNAISDHPISVGFTELFTDSESRKKFMQFVKDAWQFYQSLLVKPDSDCAIYQQNDQITCQANDEFEYFAIMPADQLSFHAPCVQLEEMVKVMTIAKSIQTVLM